MFFFLPLYDDNPTAEAPLATFFIIGLCTGAFLWEIGQSEAAQRAIVYSYGMIPAVLFGHVRLAPALAHIPAWATIFTSMFLHGGWWHLIGNMLFLWIFGNNLEDVLGRFRYLLIYFASGVVAALTQAMVNPASTVPMIGASGAIAGVLGAYFLLYPRANVHCFLWIILFFRIITVPAWILLSVWFGMQLLSGLGSAHGGSGVAFWAHVGGFLSGIVLILVLRPGGVALLQERRSRRFAATRPGDFAGRTTFYRGSVPPSGRGLPPPRRGPWG
jgi:rhomboid family protein